MLQIVLLLIAFITLASFWALAEAVFETADKSLEETNHKLTAVRIAAVLTWLAFGALAFALPATFWVAKAVIAGGAVLALMLSYVLKGRALASAETVFKAILLPIRLLLFPFLILAKLVIKVTNFFLRKLGVDPNSLGTSVSEDDIRHMVNQGGEEGSIDAAELEMINNIFEFDDKSAQDIAIHRMDIVAINADASREEIINTFIGSEYSRYPVYEESIDNIIGILHIKDILTHFFAAKDLRDDINPRDFIRDAYVVPPSKKIDKVFEEMQKAKVQMAIVADEYGGCAGLLTMEDLIEEILGDIYDEYDEIEIPDIEKISEDKYMIQGVAELSEVAEILKIDLSAEGYDTIGGFLVHLLERIPNDGEKPDIHYMGYHFQVYDVGEKRINSVLVEKSQKQEAIEE